MIMGSISYIINQIIQKLQFDRVLEKFVRGIVEVLVFICVDFMGFFNNYFLL